MEQTLEINYLVKAVDQATKTMAAIEGSLKSIYLAEEQLQKQNKLTTKTQTELYNTISKTNEVTKEMTNSISGGLISSLKKMTLEVGIFAAAWVGISSSSLLSKGILLGVTKLQTSLMEARIGVMGLAESFPTLARYADKGLLAMANGFDMIYPAMVRTAVATSNIATAGKAVVDASTSMGASFIKAATSTEPFSGGLVGLTAKSTVLGGSLLMLGTYLTKSDSTMIQLAGAGVVILSAAFYGLATIIHEVMILIGSFISGVGTSLVGSMQASVDNMAELESQTVSLGFVINALDKDTSGATGTFEHWNAIITDFSANMRFSTGETQMAVSEMLRFGNSIGLNRQQMEKILPIAGELAKVNHRDLFTSIIAVMEGMSGQTQMLRNMGVNLQEGAIQESKYAQSIGKKITTMTESEKVQVRYNVLLEKSALLAGVVAASNNTLKGALETQAVAWKNISAAMGAGAVMIEQKVNYVWGALLTILSSLSKESLSVIGFITSLTGRTLQVIGSFIQWAFAISLVVTSIKALNYLLANKYIQTFAADLAASVLVTEKLAKVSPLMASAVSGALGTIASANITVIGTFKMLGVAIASTLKVAWIAILPFIEIVAVIALVVGAGYLLYQALVRIDQQTKIFTNTWQKLVDWWDKSNIFKTMGEC